MSVNREQTKRIVKVIVAAVSIIFLGMKLVAKYKKNSVNDNKEEKYFDKILSLNTLVKKYFNNIILKQKISKQGDPELKKNGKEMFNEDIDEKNKENKKVLIVASVASMIDQFNRPNIELLQSLGYDVDVAANFAEPGTITDNRCDELLAYLHDHNIDCFQIDFDRNVLDVRAIRKAYAQLDKVFKCEAMPIQSIDRKINKIIFSDKIHDNTMYTFMHCHSPVGGAIGRVVAYKNNVKVIYTAHGFHFYEGAPLKNWVIYYPIEKQLSRITDVLITINNEDYQLAKDKFHAKKVYKIPGVGVDTKKFAICKVDKEKKREKLGIPEGAFVLLSSTEMVSKENQMTILNVINNIKLNKGHVYKNLYYIVVGRNITDNEFDKFIDNNHLRNHIKVLNNHHDISEMCEISDCYIDTSVYKKFGIDILEAMATGLPLISLYPDDYETDIKKVNNGICNINQNDIKKVEDTIYRMVSELTFRKKCQICSIDQAKKYSIKLTDVQIQMISNFDYQHLMALVTHNKIREDLLIPYDAFVIISVGELNDNKNHSVIIKALGRLQDKSIYYIVVGQGSKKSELKSLAEDLGISNNVKIIGFRSDVNDLLKAADIFAFPSKREGLGLAAIEAMASGLPLITSDVGGINDYSVEGITGYKCNPMNVEKFADNIKKMKANKNERLIMSQYNLELSNEYDIKVVERLMNSIYRSIH